MKEEHLLLLSGIWKFINQVVLIDYIIIIQGGDKMIRYDRLWETMKEKGVSQYALIKKYGISPAQITRLKRNESVSTHTIDMFCEILHCNVEDIMQFLPSSDINKSDT